MDFIAIDFETANPYWAYPCSLGITIVQNNQIQNCLSSLINPEGPFSPGNIKIHGITPNMVQNSPKFPEIWNNVFYLFRHYSVVAHNVAFDKTVLERTADRYGIDLPIMTYFCTMKLSQYNFPNAPGYSLDAICSFLNINLEHHHCCGDDSLAAANIMIALANNESTAIFAYQSSLRPQQEEGRDMHTSRFKKLFQPPDLAKSKVLFDSNIEVIFPNHKFCLTGEIAGYDRNLLSQKIVHVGGECHSAVSKFIDYLVVGLENKNVIIDPSNVKSAKVIKAEQLRAEGEKIRIITGEQLLDALKTMGE